MTSGGSPSAAPRTELSRISDAIFDVERKFGLLDRRIMEAPFWQRLRFAVHRRLLVGSGVMGPAESGGSPPWRWLHAKLRSLQASSWRSAFDSLPTCQVLFVGGGRRVMDREWGWYNPYYGPLAHGCPQASLVAEFRGASPTEAAPGVPTRYLDRINAHALLRRVTRRTVTLSEDTCSLLRNVDRELYGMTGTSADLVRMARDDLTRREVGLPLYRRLLATSGARVVVVECSYDKHTLMEAAEALDVALVEVQHGVVSHHHLGYHFPSASGKPPLFPSRFFAWGEFWRSAADLPIPDECIVPIGFPRFDREVAALQSLESAESDDILFLSQAMLGERLSRFAAALAQAGLRERIVYRLHPREEDDWRRRYPWLDAAGIRVSGPRIPLYAQLRDAPIHVGVFSTALYEGMGLGACTYLVEAPGIEYMDAVLRAGRATLVKTPEELATRISRGAPRTGRDAFTRSLFRPGSTQRACSALHELSARR